jgi:hypothetical protein
MISESAYLEAAERSEKRIATKKDAAIIREWLIEHWKDKAKSGERKT